VATEPHMDLPASKFVWQSRLAWRG